MSSQRDLNRILTLEAQMIELQARVAKLEREAADKPKTLTLEKKAS